MQYHKNPDYYVAIMAGGIGTRFWPESRISKPKQFLDVLDKGNTLLQDTFARFEKFILKENIYIVTAKEYIHLVAEQLPTLDKKNILGEPARKNTAPCVAYIAFKLKEINPNANLICAPADHLIKNADDFITTCQAALSFIDKNLNAFVTLGIKPTYAHTGYGYIQFIKEENIVIKKVKTFTEKPNLELAQHFLKTGEFLWNSGIVIAHNDTLLKAFETHMNEMYEVFEKNKTLFNSGLEHSSLEKIYPLCPNISLDYGILEKVSNVFVLPANFDWNDLGTWNSLYAESQKTTEHNVKIGNYVMCIDSKHNIIKSNKEKLVVIKGLENCIVIDTDDALLICDRNKEQEIKEVLEKIKIQQWNKYL